MHFQPLDQLPGALALQPGKWYNIYTLKNGTANTPLQTIDTFFNHGINISGSSLISSYVSLNSDFAVYTSYLSPKICNW